MFHVPNKYRVRQGNLASNESFGNNGFFIIPFVRKQFNGKKLLTELRVQASDGASWEHVSVSLPDRCPTWTEMCFIKDLFWDDSDCVIQFHPPKSEYVNRHPFCLHLWRPTEVEIPTPHKILVG